MSNQEEIATLLDQCTPEELNNILATIESGLPLPAEPPAAAAAGQDASRRPVPPSVKKAVEENQEVTMDELKKMLAEHTAGVLSELKKLLPGGEGFAPGEEGDGTVDMSVLTTALAERDNEVKELETKLAGLQAELALKDQRVAELGTELDSTVREVRHKQLDLEFQQLKLEERVRGNAELEQAQRNLSARVEEASLNARHAALDLDMARVTPRSIRAQGSLPWTLRNKSRLPALGQGEGQSPQP